MPLVPLSDILPFPQSSIGSGKSHRILKEFLNWHQISFHCVFLPWILYHEEKSPEKVQDPCCRFYLWGKHKNTPLSKVQDSTHKPSKLFSWNRWRKTFLAFGWLGALQHLCLLSTQFPTTFPGKMEGNHHRLVVFPWSTTELKAGTWNKNCLIIVRDSNCCLALTSWFSLVNVGFCFLFSYVFLNFLLVLLFVHSKLGSRLACVGWFHPIPLGPLSFLPSSSLQKCYWRLQDASDS